MLSPLTVAEISCWPPAAFPSASSQWMFNFHPTEHLLFGLRSLSFVTWCSPIISITWCSYTALKIDWIRTKWIFSLVSNGFLVMIAPYVPISKMFRSLHTEIRLFGYCSPSINEKILILWARCTIPLFQSRTPVLALLLTLYGVVEGFLSGSAKLFPDCFPSTSE